MSNMVLGGYTFASNPSEIDDIMMPVKRSASQETYTSVAFFSWGTSIVGKIIEFTWDYMPCSMFDSLKTFYQADLQVVFDPQDGSSKTYNVEIADLNGKYHLGLASSADWERKDVKLQLLIMSEV